eukprot:GHVR01004550.1.p2 GENE.GHVR01004550.1~~GHVR01004550.1.p2  ORF type:complete len:102 (-),score=11.54 GHVR01004550.1:837-1142(-)
MVKQVNKDKINVPPKKGSASQSVLEGSRQVVAPKPKGTKDYLREVFGVKFYPPSKEFVDDYEDLDYLLAMATSFTLNSTQISRYPQVSPRFWSYKLDSDGN